MTEFKHIFVVNPMAGKTDATTELIDKLHRYDGRIDYEVYVTKGPFDATKYVRQYCAEHPEKRIRFYACGGDGTSNEVASGLVGARNVEMTNYASGSGNDYIKYYGTREEFQNLDLLINGETHMVDLMQVKVMGEETKTRYSINVTNFGFDAAVCKTMQEVKRKPVIGGSHAYTTGIVKSFFSSRENYINMSVDGEHLFQGEMLMCTLSNGQYVGGSYKCAPRSVNDDGLIEVCLIKTLKVHDMVKFIKDYRQGNHLDNPQTLPHLLYRQGRVVDLFADEPFDLTVDGELLNATHFRVTQMDKAIAFVTPKRN